MKIGKTAVDDALTTIAKGAGDRHRTDHRESTGISSSISPPMASTHQLERRCAPVSGAEK